jgi:thiol-disulfide isomerase/thioredoxin
VSREIVFVTRAGCGLCDAVLPEVERWANRLGLTVRTVDVDRDGSADRYGDRVPVVLGGGREITSGRIRTTPLVLGMMRARLHR